MSFDYFVSEDSGWTETYTMDGVIQESGGADDASVSS